MFKLLIPEKRRAFKKNYLNVSGTVSGKGNVTTLHSFGM